MESNLNAQTNPRDQTGHQDSMTPQDYLRQIKANYPDLKTALEMRVFEDTDNVDKVITLEDLIKKKKNAVYFKNCKNSTFKIAQNVETVKILIEKCTNCKFTFSGTIRTGTIEAWRSSDLHINVDTEVGTLQLDLADRTHINYTHKIYLGSIVQAGMRDLKISFEDTPALDFQSGVEVLKVDNPELDENFDQYITRFIDGGLITEKIIRYKDGFHTTEREKAKEDADKARGEEYTMEKVRNMVKVAGPAVGINESDLAAKSKQGKEEEAKKGELEAQSNLKKHAGNKFFTNGQYDKALLAYTEAINLTPDNYVLYSNRSLTHSNLNDIEKALEDAEKCISLKSDFPKGHFLKGTILLKKGKKEEAIASLTEAHNLAPKDEEITNFLKQAKEN